MYIIYIYLLSGFFYWFLQQQETRHCCRTSLCVSIFVTRPVIALFAQLRPAVAAVAVVVSVVVAAAAAVVARLLVVVIVIFVLVVLSQARPGTGDCGLWTELLQQCAFN